MDEIHANFMTTVSAPDVYAIMMRLRKQAKRSSPYWEIRASKSDLSLQQLATGWHLVKKCFLEVLENSVL